MKSFRLLTLLSFLLFLVGFTPAFGQADKVRFEPDTTREQFYDRAALASIAREQKLNEGDLAKLLRLQRAYREDYARLVTTKEKQQRTDLYQQEILVVLNSGSRNGSVTLKR